MDAAYVSFDYSDPSAPTVTLDRSILSTADKLLPHAVYIQGYDMSGITATNWVCFMVTDDTAVEFCENFCRIARIQPTANKYVEILTDQDSCIDSVDTGDQFQYYTNDENAICLSTCASACWSRRSC